MSKFLYPRFGPLRLCYRNDVSYCGQCKQRIHVSTCCEQTIQVDWNRDNDRKTILCLICAKHPNVSLLNLE